ncbi:Membrane-bound lytic murein transglycosylase D precursor [Arcticibacter svalbardensis MN12-7]|uniref:Membrane-bound lytic murein transglycosylase D n=1 Tax=Arcticibacter svalbardensis MN12-7 TaxID=1150600 RepID=R9GU15_9SPHI|nr:lytic transglycosylase domain-containing protein [Arcticibacter svalbardensis]EOR95035.1 Membrane-bound lytic murein transglycosylase D precursor [Arcticibacter svalbardensis MN12-7]
MIKNAALALFLLVGSICSTFADPSTGNLTSGNSTISLSDSLVYKRSLQSIQNRVPLTYNAEVQRYIDGYVRGQKSRVSKMLGLSKYYFPIYDKIFENRNVPEELKYISVIESSLDPHAVSHMGATGPWQFLYEIGKLYGLQINDWIDERKDPKLACNAAASYLLESYYMYDDWLLAIASYNCGRNNIKWAMDKAGGKTDYWSIRRYLPLETQNYVPAYIATVYIMNNYWKHDIKPGEAEIALETETIPVSSTVSLGSIAAASNMTIDEITLLNPSYIQQIIKGSPEKPQKLVMPLTRKVYYSLVDDVLNGKAITAGQLQAANNLFFQNQRTTVRKSTGASGFDSIISYRVKEGDTLSSIAEQFRGATEEEIRVINKIKNPSAVKPGMILRIIGG